MWIIFYFDKFLNHLFARRVPIAHNTANDAFHFQNLKNTVEISTIEQRE